MKLEEILIWFCWLPVLSSCSSDDGIINPSSLKIFVNNSLELDVLATEVVPISNSDYLVFGVCGNAPSTRFDGSGSIYLRKIDNLGKTQWDTCFTVSGNPGFPTNLVRLGDSEFTVFWNDLGSNDQQMVSFQISSSGAVFDENQSLLNCNFNCGTIMYASLATDPDQINLLGFGFDPISSLSTTYISRVNPSSGENQARSQRTFQAERFGGAGQNDLNLLKSVENYLFLTVTDNRLLFTGPLGDKMSMSHVGETDALYQDELFWISAVEKLEEEPNNAAIVVSSPNRPDNPSFLIPRILLDDLPRQINFGVLSANNDLVEMFNIDAGSKIFIKKVANRNNLVVAGTSRTGQPILYVFDGENLVPKELGNTVQYKVGGIAQSGNGQDFVLVGTTKIENRDQRLFWIKIELNELLSL